MQFVSAAEWLRALKFVVSLAIIAAIVTLYRFLLAVNATTVALSLLLGVLGIAAVWGLAEAVVASLAAVLCFNFFFLPPTGTFTIEDPQNWIALFAFLVVAVTASQLSASARRRAREAEQKQAEMEKLYALSRGLLLANPAGDMAAEIARQIASVFGAGSVLLYDRKRDTVHRAGPGDAPPDIEGALRDAALGSAPVARPGGARILPIALGGEPVAALAVSEAPISATALQSAATLAAIALERARTTEAGSRAEAARQSEELKSTLLDVLAHEFKTPLTSIKASASALLARPEDAGGDDRELLTVIDEEADRLNAMVSETVQIARIEAGDLRLERRPARLNPLAASALARFRAAAEQRTIAVAIPPDLPPVEVDRELITIVLVHLLDNALKYSPPGTPVSISAETRGAMVTVTVADRGPGVAPRDRERIFEKFYRAEQIRSAVPGTGMGLAIAREIVAAHGGRIWVQDAEEGGGRFCFTVPAARPEDAA